ncbi:MAG: penicillin-binding protein, partial [Fusobacterium periodonticum]|nr:penicillin-binding protein [Fusobacterium periodonticum]
MYYIYSKEKLPKLLFDVNLTSEEVKLYGGWDVIFGYYPNIQKDNSTIIERDTPFNYPIFDNNTIREMTRDEKVANDIEITLEVGEFIENKKLIKVPKPQGNDKYLNWNSEKHLWILDTEAQRKDYFNTIDSLKAEVLDYGFDYKVDKTEHRQRCRDTDISKMVATVVALQLAKNIGADKKITWYFEDNFGMNAGLQELGMLMLFGT